MGRSELILAYQAGIESINQAVRGLDPAQLRARPAAGMWSALEVVCHLADSEALFADRMKRVLAEDRPVLPDLDLVVPAGQTLALVGTTGAGKTTRAKLATRFYDPTAGRVLLDGIDLRDLTSADLRRSVVMVTQENYLFSGTIADNIRFGRPSATMAEIEQATKALGSHDFITALP